MERIKIDLDWAGAGERKTADGGGTAESCIRLDALQQVMLRLVVKPQGRSERTDHYRRRPLELDVMAYRRHDAILVSARRGDGKTTFLTDILQLLQQGRDTYRRILPDGMSEDQIAVLYPLGIVDPTLIETKQNIVVIVIEKIDMAVKRAYRLDESAKKGEYEDFRRVLHELATGLNLLDGIGTARSMARTGPMPTISWNVALRRRAARVRSSALFTAMSRPRASSSALTRSC